MLSMSNKLCSRMRFSGRFEGRKDLKWCCVWTISLEGIKRTYLSITYMCDAMCQSGMEWIMYKIHPILRYSVIAIPKCWFFFQRLPISKTEHYMIERFSQLKLTTQKAHTDIGVEYVMRKWMVHFPLWSEHVSGHVGFFCFFQYRLILNLHVSCCILANNCYILDQLVVTFRQLLQNV